MDGRVQKERDRAARIAFTTEGFHTSVAMIYEKLVDREYESVKNDIKSLIKDLRDIIKTIEYDEDF
jgi:hypothetical protein